LIFLINSRYTILLVVMLYYCGTLFEISEYFCESIFTPTRNVYVDGVYDLCHIGHINAFKQALHYGTRLFVGILSDEDVMRYKRRPIMTMNERVEEVRTCKYVHKVIYPAPFPGIPEGFIKQHRIHVVCLSPEYDKPDDIYYAVPRRMGITVVTQRTEGLSTSELIKRVQSLSQDKKPQ